MGKNDGVIFKFLVLLMNVLQHLRRPVVASMLTLFAMTLLFKIFLIEQSQLVISDVTTRVKLLGFVSETGEHQHQQQNEILPNFTVPNLTSSASLTIQNFSSLPKIEFQTEEVVNRLKLVTEKGTQKYLQDHLSYIESILSKLKSNFTNSNETFSVDFRRRVMLVTTWRSGSTFLAELLSSYPATFYHYEPFTGHGIHRLRDANETQLASDMIKTLLNCSYNLHVEKYLKYYSITRPELMSYNRGLWPKCKINRSWCLRPEFIDNLCLMYPFQVMKTVRVGLNVTRSILEDPSYSDVRILLLVRDPRGTMASRSHRDWCPKNPDCDQPEQLCQDLVEDYMVAKELMEKFPNRIKIVRYEDMTDHVVQMTKDIFNFLDLPIQPETYKFLKEHCDPSVWKKAHVVPQVWNTFRDPSQTSDKWKQDLKFATINKIQEACKLAMKLWEYQPINQVQLRQNVLDAKAVTLKASKYKPFIL